MQKTELFRSAYELYDAGKYTDAASKAMDIMKGIMAEEPADMNQLMREGWIIAARALMLSTANASGENLKKARELYNNMLRSATGYATTLAEVFEVEMEAAKEHAKTRLTSCKRKLERLESNPSFDNWKEIINQEVDFISASIEIISSVRNSDKAEALAAEAGVSVGDASEQYAPDSIDIMIGDGDVKAAISETAERIFSRACRYFSNNNRGPSLDALDSVFRKTLLDLTIADLMFGYGVPDDEKPTPAQLTAMKKQAMVQQYKLDAVMYVGERPVSLVRTDRMDNVRELRALYFRIQGEDTTFVAPSIQETAYDMPGTPSGGNTAAGNSGCGCYVATAVYGSYDCPQVWTLRRFRDNTLAETWYGRAFIKTYYAVSPTLVKWFGHTEWFKKMWKGTLDKMVRSLNEQGVENTPYEDKNW